MKYPAIRLLLAFCPLLLLAAPGAVFPEPAPPEVVAAAAAGLAPFLQSIPASDLEGYGFAPGDHLGDVALGEPFQLYTIAPQALLDCGPEATVSSLLSPTGTWFFPVEIGGVPRYILTVAETNGGWAAVGIGKAALAGELGAVRRQWGPAGFPPRLVAVFQASAYFFTLPGLDDYNFTPMSFAGRGFAPELKTGPGYPETVELSQVIENLKAAVAENLKGQDF